MKKLITVIVITLILFVSCYSLNTNKESVFADTVVVGNIYTADSNHSFAEAFAVKDGKYIYVGTEEEAQKYIGEDTVLINSSFVMPGATEAHGHYILEAAFKLGCYIPVETASTDEIIQIIINWYSKNPNVDCIYAYGWDNSLLYEHEAEFTRQRLDEFFPDIPVFISDNYLHSGWCNTACLSAAGVLDKEVAVKIVKRNESNIATGLVLDEACSYVRNLVFGALLDDGSYRVAITDAAKTLNSMGYTSHYDAWSNFDGTDSMYKAINTVDKEGLSTILFTSAWCINTFDDYDYSITKAVELKEQYTSMHFKPQFVKMFADGTVEARTGFVLDPYYGGEYGNIYGSRNWNPEDMDYVVDKANSLGMMVHIHTYGDAAVAEAIDSIEKSLKNNGYIRNSFAHTALVSDDDYSRIEENGIGVACGANWSGTNIQLYEDYLVHLLGQKKAKSLYPEYDFLKNGIKAAISTDHPCTTPGCAESVFDYLGFLVTGVDYKSDEIFPARRTEHCNIFDAIDMLTINGAWMGGFEAERGSIETGKYADFLLADNSPFNVSEDKICEIKLLATFFEGKQVW